jgi:hypothetical protein
MLSVIHAECRYVKCRHAECHGAIKGGGDTVCRTGSEQSHLKLWTVFTTLHFLRN